VSGAFGKWGREHRHGVASGLPRAQQRTCCHGSDLLPSPFASSLQRHAEEAVAIRQEANVRYSELMEQLQSERDARAALEVRFGRACWSFNQRLVPPEAPLG